MTRRATTCGFPSRCRADAYDWRKPVDVSTEIDRPRDEVAAHVADLDHTTNWYVNIKSVEWQTPRPAAVGSQVAFVAQFLGRRIEYTYQVRALEPGERLVMSTEQRPFPMETTYEWSDTPSGGTRMVLRNRGEPAGFAKIAGPAMARAMRRANQKDLERLKSILESTT